MRGVARSGHSLVAFSRDVVLRAAPRRSRSRPSSAIDPRRARRGRTMPASEASGEDAAARREGCMRLTTRRVPQNPSMKERTGLPFAVAVQPFAPLPASPDAGDVRWSPRTWWRGAASASGTSTASAVSSATVGSACLRRVLVLERQGRGEAPRRHSRYRRNPDRHALPELARAEYELEVAREISPWTRATRSAPPPRASPSSTSPHPRRPSSSSAPPSSPRSRRSARTPSSASSRFPIASASTTSRDPRPPCDTSPSPREDTSRSPSRTPFPSDDSSRPSDDAKTPSSPPSTGSRPSRRRRVSPRRRRPRHRRRRRRGGRAGRR